MTISFGHRPGAETEPRIEGPSMLEPQHNDLSGVAAAAVGVRNRDAGREPLRRKPGGLTIPVETIDRILAEIPSPLAMLRRESTDLGLGLGAVGQQGIDGERRMNDAPVAHGRCGMSVWTGMPAGGLCP
jgi:hypothetical protein